MKTDLSQFKVKAILQQWSLAQVKGRTADAVGPVGQVVLFNSSGQTTSIKGFDPVTQRIITNSGSVYKLGVPNMGFAVKKRDLMETLGF